MSVRVGVLGATTPVGHQLVSQLQETAQFEITSLTHCGTETSKSYTEAIEDAGLEPIPGEIGSQSTIPTDPEAMDDDVTLLFSALPAAIAEEAEPAFLEEGYTLSSVAPNERLAPDVPLVIPEVNAEHLGLLEIQQTTRQWNGVLIKAPSTPVSMLSVILSSLSELSVESVTASVLQSQSPSPTERTTSSDDAGQSSESTRLDPYLPGEESRLRTEPTKLLGTFEGETVTSSDIAITASCNRGPFADHSFLDVWLTIDTDDAWSLADIENALRDGPRVELPSAPAKSLEVFVDPGQPQLDAPNLLEPATVGIGGINETATGIQFHCVANDSRRGAVGTSICNAELLIANNYM